MKLTKQALSIDGEDILCEYKLDKINAVIFHGGSADHTRFLPIAEELDKRNIGVVLFDFSGHGKSSGDIKELSLARRATQARGVIEQIVPTDTQLYLIGFSMGAQTVCDLLPELGDRAPAILLACPAIYRSDVKSLPFGSDEFTADIRQEGSWKTSDAASNLSLYTGRTVIAIGSDDQIIPSGVTEELMAAAQHATYKEYAGVPHQLATWLGEHRQEIPGLIDLVIKPTSEQLV